jgi:hypothetical protein
MIVKLRAREICRETFVRIEKSPLEKESVEVAPGLPGQISGGLFRLSRNPAFDLLSAHRAWNVSGPEGLSLEIADAAPSLRCGADGLNPASVSQLTSRLPSQADSQGAVTRWTGVGEFKSLVNIGPPFVFP